MHPFMDVKRALKKRRTCLGSQCALLTKCWTELTEEVGVSLFLLFVLLFLLALSLESDTFRYKHQSTTYSSFLTSQPVHP